MTNTESQQVNAFYLPRDCSDIHWQQPEGLSGVYQTFPTLDPKVRLSLCVELCKMQSMLPPCQENQKFNHATKRLWHHDENVISH